MSTPIKERMETERTMRRRPTMAAMRVCLPESRRAGSPEEVAILKEPKRIKIKAIPPARLRRAVMRELAMPSPLAGMQPMAVHMPSVSSTQALHWAARGPACWQTWSMYKV